MMMLLKKFKWDDTFDAFVGHVCACSSWHNFTKELSWETLEDCHLCRQLQILAADYKSGIYYYNCLDI
jgi:hypothetical protein